MTLLLLKFIKLPETSTEDTNISKKKEEIILPLLLCSIKEKPWGNPTALLISVTVF